MQLSYTPKVWVPFIFHVSAEKLCVNHEGAYQSVYLDGNSDLLK